MKNIFKLAVAILIGYMMYEMTCVCFSNGNYWVSFIFGVILGGAALVLFIVAASVVIVELINHFKK